MDSLETLWAIPQMKEGQRVVSVWRGGEPIFTGYEGWDTSKSEQMGSFSMEEWLGAGWPLMVTVLQATKITIAIEQFGG